VEIAQQVAALAHVIAQHTRCHFRPLNAVAAIAVARELGVSAADIRKGLAGFGGVRRRFTTTGVANGVRIIDDYGHHPVEIASVLKAAKPISCAALRRRAALSETLPLR